jgi:glycosyltransferase involved in cell wall biosynthesis
MALVSVIIPVFNNANGLLRAVRSALAQTCVGEIVIIDDLSRDESFAAACRLAAQDERIQALQTDRNGGPGVARNLGARTARCDYLSFLDADDELIGEFFTEALEMMSRQPEMRVVKGEMEFIDPVKGYILPAFDPRYTSVALSSSCGMVIDRASFVRLGGFPGDPAFRGPMGGEDVAFMEAVIKHLQPIGRINRPCYRVWSQAGSHVDKFLANTRLKGDSFEFVRLHSDQAPDGPLAKALLAYHEAVAQRMNTALAQQ